MQLCRWRERVENLFLTFFHRWHCLRALKCSLFYPAVSTSSLSIDLHSLVSVYRDILLVSGYGWNYHGDKLDWPKRFRHESELSLPLQIFGTVRATFEAALSISSPSCESLYWLSCFRVTFIFQLCDQSLKPFMVFQFMVMGALECNALMDNTCPFCQEIEGLGDHQLPPKKSHSRTIQSPSKGFSIWSDWLICSTFHQIFILGAQEKLLWLVHRSGIEYIVVESLNLCNWI